MSATENLLRTASQKLKLSGVESPAKEARLLLAHAMSARPEDLISGRFEPDAKALTRFDALVARRVAHEPMAYILGRREFWSLNFTVGSGALISRPETETLIEEALKHFPDRDAQLTVLDLGTGSGVLLLSTLSERPNATGTGIDISPQALAFAERNAAALGLSNRVKFLRTDWSTLDGSFDIVLANPPYIASRDIESLALDVLAYEPHIALDGGADGLDAYRRIAEILPGLLASKGAAFVEMGQGQAEHIAAIFAARGLAEERIVKDLAGISRCLVLVHAMEEQQVKQKKGMAKETRSG